MKKTILIAGATGLIGSTLLNCIKADAYFENISLLLRKSIPDIGTQKEDFPEIEQHLIDFDQPEQHKSVIRGDIVISTLGTTLSKAGSKAAFTKVDLDYPLAIAKHALENGATTLLFVSSIGADPNSRSFYLKTKGQLEKEAKSLGYQNLHILRPSLLLGKRDEFRLAEDVGKKVSKGLSFLIPAKYKPIESLIVAQKLHELSKSPVKGVTIHEGKDMYPNRTESL